MRLLTFVAAGLWLTAAAEACARYRYCHCYDSNGEYNKNATTKACEDAKGQMQGEECYYYNEQMIGTPDAISNCSFRKNCVIHGATGADSSCRRKLK
ncbi:hypothetical protein CTRI78_v011231 [Colletotrichum trifolii]|uniref:Extracellular membrane protein CFEM domain-containing protein n=1 Tax=Colletotrichum trifolii TaxID=5466 RepID=A0A4R8QMK3_COLTR|nr:hypothetical protein CTRI78_v011231 [Colletotrichum trifolii]